MLKVGFYLRELNFRGIANSIFIYAKSNQTILKNKSIIFYNSSALDNKTELGVMNSINLIRDDITVIIIAHRLSTVKNADRILFLEKGKIENEGPHKELIRNNKKYKKLADLQFL